MRDLNYKTKELYSDDADSAGFLDKILKKGKGVAVAAASLPFIILPSYSHAVVYATAMSKGNSMGVGTTSSSHHPDSVTISWYNAAGCYDFSIYRRLLGDDDWHIVSYYSDDRITDSVQLNTKYEYKLVPNSNTGEECPIYIFELDTKDNGMVDIKWKTEPPKNLRFIVE